MTGAAACRRKSRSRRRVATPSFSANQTRVPLGSPVEVTYKFVVAKDAPKITEDFRVFVHFLDADNERLWTDDHDLPVPTTQWKPGQTIEYTQNDVRADRAPRGCDQSPDGPVFERIRLAAAACRHQFTTAAPMSSERSIC